MWRCHAPRRTLADSDGEGVVDLGVQQAAIDQPCAAIDYATPARAKARTPIVARTSPLVPQGINALLICKVVAAMGRLAW